VVKGRGEWCQFGKSGDDGLLDDGNLKFRPMVLPDELFEAGTQQEQYDMAKLNHPHIAELLQNLLNKNTKVPVLEEQVAKQA
jgi:1-deoxy-D-xylulose-5-phosphate synthase